MVQLVSQLAPRPGRRPVPSAGSLCRSSTRETEPGSDGRQAHPPPGRFRRRLRSHRSPARRGDAGGAHQATRSPSGRSRRQRTAARWRGSRRRETPGCCLQDCRCRRGSGASRKNLRTPPSRRCRQACPSTAGAQHAMRRIRSRNHGSVFRAETWRISSQDRRNVPLLFSFAQANFATRRIKSTGNAPVFRPGRVVVP